MYIGYCFERGAIMGGARDPRVLQLHCVDTRFSNAYADCALWLDARGMGTSISGPGHRALAARLRVRVHSSLRGHLGAYSQPLFHGGGPLSNVITWPGLDRVVSVKSSRCAHMVVGQSSSTCLGPVRVCLPQ